MHHPNSISSRLRPGSSTQSDKDDNLLSVTTDRLARKYGEVLDVTDVAHLYGKSESRIQRWMVLSPAWRTLRSRGVKVGRNVTWPVLVIAEFVVHGTPGDAA